MMKTKSRKKSKSNIRSIRLSETENKKLEVFAKVRNCSISQVIREALEAELLNPDKRSKEVFKYLAAAAEIIDREECRRRGN